MSKNPYFHELYFSECYPGASPSIADDNGSRGADPATWVLEKTCEDGTRTDGFWATTAGITDGYFVVDIGCLRFVSIVRLINSKNNGKFNER